MALVTTDRVKESCAVAGLNDVTLTGSQSGFKTFSSVMGIGDTCYYSIVNTNTGDWETGIGTLSSSNILARTTVKTSNNSNSKVPFTDGNKLISLAFTADQLAKYALV